MSLINERIANIYEQLIKSYGPQHWWPGEGKFECMVGAILTQNTSWSNVEKAIGRLKSEIELTVNSINEIPTDLLSDLIRPAGYHNQKALRLKGFAEFLIDNFEGILERMQAIETEQLRNMLLSVKGIGPETADSILLYALERPVFLIDKYTYRILYRHGITYSECSYDEMQALFTGNLPEDTQMFNEFHALIVKVGKNHCGKKANCKNCPLEGDPHENSDELI